VWFDALCNYVTALDYGGDGEAWRRWWGGDGDRIHLLGKGVLRFHAVYWPAMLLSAGLPLPTAIFVHDYLTAGGRKISKSAPGAAAVEPAALAAAYGADALRWWLLREVPRTGDADFTVERLTARADDELAHGLGNLVNRVVAMIHRYRDGRVPGAGPVPPGGEDLAAAIGQAGDRIGAALGDFDFRQATAAVWAIADEANRFINRVRPWDLASRERTDDDQSRARLDAVLSLLARACSALGRELAPFLPDAAARITAQCTPGDDRTLPAPSPVFRRLTPPQPASPPARVPAGSGSAG
jgi:methionyl-tRNA synthetase